MQLRFLALVAAALCDLAASESSTSVSGVPFDPRGYSKTIATCKAVKRDQEEHETVDIHLRASLTALVASRCRALILVSLIFPGYVNINPSAPTTLIMVHGWPSLWSTWSNQITEFKVRVALSIVLIRPASREKPCRTNITSLSLIYAVSASRLIRAMLRAKELCRTW